MATHILTTSLDADVRNADWKRTRTWDFPSFDLFLRVIKATDNLPLAERRAAVERFMRLPAAEAMPESVRHELIALGLLDE